MGEGSSPPGRRVSLGGCGVKIPDEGDTFGPADYETTCDVCGLGEDARLTAAGEGLRPFAGFLLGWLGGKYREEDGQGENPAISCSRAGVESLAVPIVAQSCADHGQ